MFEKSLQQARYIDYPCLVSKYFFLFAVVLISILFRRLSFLFVFLVVYLSLFKIKHYTYSEIFELIKRTGDFKELDLSAGNILLIAAGLAYDGSIKASIDTFKLYKSIAKKLLSVLGIVISPLTFGIMLLYSIFELVVFFTIAKRKKFIVLFSQKIYWKLTRTVAWSNKGLKTQDFYTHGFKWCGIPGIILIPEQFLDLIVKWDTKE
jgi:hypothetical protein